MAFGNSARRKSRVPINREKDARLCNPKGIESFSPGLRGTSYPGSQAAWISTPTGLGRVSAEPQPRWGCWPSATFPRVARSSQPWALGRNPFGIHLWNFRKSLGLRRDRLLWRRHSSRSRDAADRLARQQFGEKFVRRDELRADARRREIHPAGSRLVPLRTRDERHLPSRLAWRRAGGEADFSQR